MQLFKIVGNWLRGLYLMGFGGLWLGFAYYLSNFGETPTVLGLTIFGTLFLASGFVIFVRGLLFAVQRAPIPKEAVGWRDNGERAEPEGDFDPEEAIARYLKRKQAQEGAAPKADQDESVAQAAPRPQFGRRGL